jgi:hypothetical protein
MTGNKLLINLRLFAFLRRNLALRSRPETIMVQWDGNQVGYMITGIAIALVLCAIFFRMLFLFFSPTLPFVE